jgi:hypothetical protein
VPAVPPHLIDPIFEQFAALLPERNVDHPLAVIALAYQTG